MIYNINYIIFLINYLCSQSVFNSFGLGLSPTSYHTSVNGAGSIGLVPTFHPGVSMENVATWPGLNYTFVSASYSNLLFGNEKNDISNQARTFSKIKFIIPISLNFFIPSFPCELKNSNPTFMVKILCLIFFYCGFFWLLSFFHGISSRVFSYLLWFP